MIVNTVVSKSLSKAAKTSTPVVTSLYIQFNLPLRNADISLFREAALRCIDSDETREVFSNETRDREGRQKNIMQYPLVQYRVRNGYAVLWCMNKAVPLVEAFVQQYSKAFRWMGQPFRLQAVQQVKENNFKVKTFNAKLHLQPAVFRLYVYIPFTNAGPSKNYDWLKENRNLPDTEKTKKMEQLLLNHLCSFVHYAGGFIPKQKIKLSILDKKALQKIRYNDTEYAAYDLRYTVNLYLPDYIGVGNHCSHGFGWQRLEKV